MKLYLDTNILFFLYTGATDEVSRDVQTLIGDYENIILTSTICVQECIHLCHIGKGGNAKKKDAPDAESVVDWLHERISGLFRSPKSICGHTPPFPSKTIIATRTTVSLLRKPSRIEPLWLAPTINLLGTKRKGWNLYLIKGKQELIHFLNAVRKADSRGKTWRQPFSFHSASVARPTACITLSKPTRQNKSKPRKTSRDSKRL